MADGDDHSDGRGRYLIRIVRRAHHIGLLSRHVYKQRVHDLARPTPDEFRHMCRSVDDDEETARGNELPGGSRFAAV